MECNVCLIGKLDHVRSWYRVVLQCHRLKGDVLALDAESQTSYQQVFKIPRELKTRALLRELSKLFEECIF
jgi:hypothetical protein